MLIAVANAATKLLEVGDLEKRVEGLEATLRSRHQPEAQKKRWWSR